MALVRKDTNAIINTTTTTPTISVGDGGFEEKNKGGLIGGIGYLGEKVASGAVQSIEGISDYAIGGIAKLFGFDKFAERQFRNDWFGDWYEKSGDWFNAGKGWQVAGDVAGGIGTSLPAMAAALGLTLATGGAGAGAAASFLTAGLGAAGNATKEAYRETGNLGGKEFGYGALTGALEGGLEGLTNLIGIGGGAAINHIAKSTAKGATLSALRNGIGATMAKSFLGEAFEEGVSEIFNAPFKRLTYDKDAEGTTASQVLYASLIGGLSGLVMGSTSIYSTARNIGRGQQIAEKGETEGVLAFAEEVMRKAEAEKLGDIRQYKQVAETYKALTESLKKTNGEVKTAAQKRMLGELKIDNIAAVFTPKMLNETRNVLNNVDLIAEVYSTVDENGNKVTYTKEQLLKGVDLNNLRETLPKALETNEALRKVVFDSIAGQMIMDANAFQEAIISGKRFAGEADLERFRIEATTEQKREVERLLDIDNIDTVDSATFNAKAQAFIDSGKRDEFLELNKQMEARKAESTPLSSELSTTEATVEATTEATTTPKSADITSVPLREAMDFATKNVKEYKNLDSENQARIRRLIRQMKANGFTDAQTKAYARVSARSNIDIVVGKSDRLYRGNGKYADGLYSAKENRIYVNPEGSRSPARLLVHELTHALYTDAESKVWLDEEAKNLPEEEKKIVKALYFNNANLDENTLSNDEREVYDDEISSRYMEKMLDDEVLLQKLCDEHPTIKDKILNFFKGAEKDYADTPELSREAKKLYKKYKDVFDKFSEENKFGLRVAKGDRMTVSDAEFNLDDFTIDDLLKFTSEDYKQAYESLGVDDILDDFSDLDWLNDNISIDDVSEKLNADAKKVEILIRREGLGDEYVDEKRRAVMKQSRIDEAIEDSGAKFNPDYARKYITRISPKDFIDLTISKNHLDRQEFDSNVRGDHGSTMQNYDYEKALQESSNPYLHIDRTTGRIIGHNGRHRMRALELSGIKSVEIEVEFYDDEGYLIKYNANTIPNMAISSQFDTAIETHLSNVIPLNETYRSEIEKYYGEKANKNAGVRYAESDSDLDNINEELYNNFTMTVNFSQEVFGEDRSSFTRILANKTKGIKKGETRRIVINGTNGFYFFKAYGYMTGEIYEYVPSGVRLYNQKRKEFLNGIDENREDSSLRSDLDAFDTGRDIGYSAFFEDGAEYGDNDYMAEKTPQGDSARSVRSGRDYNGEDKKTNEIIRKLKEMYGDPNRRLAISDDEIANYKNVFGEERLKDGTRVKANDRGNIGTITGYDNATKQYSVRFVSKDGLSRTIQMTADMFTPLKKTTKKTTQVKTSKANTSQEQTTETDEEVNELDMSESVGKHKQQYKETAKSKFKTLVDSAYIELVDEMYGVAKYLKRYGKIGGRADTLIQAIRASRSAAQTMIGDVQKDIFNNGKVLGEGLMKIIKPIKVKGENVYKSFNEYMLHWLNVDRMTLEERSLAELAELQSELEASVGEVREINQLIAEGQDEKTTKELRAKKVKLLKEIKQKKKAIDNFEVMQNKPVYGINENRAEALTAEQSRQRIAELERVHPDFRKTAEKVWAYTKNLNHMRTEAGLISEDSEIYMSELYPHYVPAYRDFSYSGASAIKGKGNLEISSTVKRAKGGGQDIRDIADSIATQTQEVMRAGRINQLFTELYNAANMEGGSEYVEIVGEENVSPKDSASMQSDSIELKPKTNQITGFVNGKKVTLAVAEEIFIGFDSIGKTSVDPTNKIATTAQKVNELYKRLITSLNPGFMITNPIKDLQDAGLNSKHVRLFAKNLKIAAKQMMENSENWQLYRAYGGYSSSIFNNEGGFTSDLDKRGFAEMVELLEVGDSNLKTAWNVLRNSGKNVFTAIENANAFVEQVTRFTEFLASVEAGDSIDTAIYNSAEVSTNFGRRGRTTKVFNATIMPFLNPSIQGFDKMIRNVTDAFTSEQTAKAFGKLFAKAAIIGLAPMVINMLLWGDDDDYKDLRETDKENYFLIKVGKGKFIKIPRGRVASVIGGAANRTTKLVKGENADIKGYLDNIVNQVTPVQNFTRTIFSPFFDAKNNRTWYGSEIEGRQWENTAPKERYDESTSSIAIAIGKVTGWSPKKIHYVLDQYSGVIGDFVLPATTSKAERGFFTNKFSIDAATSNKLSTEFYKIYDKAQYAKTAGDETAIYQVKYLNMIKKSINELHDEKQSIQRDETLSRVDKLQKSRVVQILINEAYKSAMEDYEAYTQVIAATEGIENTEAFKNIYEGNATEENIQKMRYTEAIRYMYGAERALKEYNSDVYAKSRLLNSAGVDYEVIYNDYFVSKSATSDTDKKGNAISGSKRKKVVSAITSMNIPTEQKLLLIASKGYALQDGDIRGLSGDAAKKKLLNYILKLNISKEERIRLAEMCGFEVKNGKIIMGNSKK